MERLGNHLPQHIIEEKIFVEGGTFLRKAYQFRNEKPKNRRFFVLNKNPKQDNRILTVHATTKAETRKAVRPPEVLVEIKSAEYESLQEDSIVDCESWKVWHKPHLQQEIADGKIEVLAQLPYPILDKLREAISRSKTLYPIDKRLIIPED